MGDRKHELCVTAGLQSPLEHADEAKRLWRLGHCFIEDVVAGTASETVNSDLRWVKNELRKQLVMVEHLVPGLNAGSLELFRLYDYMDGRLGVIDESAGIAWTIERYHKAGGGDLRKDMSDCSDQVNDWFANIRNQINDRLAADWVTLKKSEIEAKWTMPDSNFGRLARQRPDLIVKAGPRKWRVNQSHPDLHEL